MTRIIDLTRDLGSEMGAVVPGHPVVVYDEFHNHEEHGRTNATLSFSIHTATHIDPPYHFVKDGKTIDKIALERLMAPGYVLDIRKTSTAGDAIYPSDLPDLEPGVLAGRIVILRTGWGEDAYERPDYYTNGPFLSEELAKWFVAEGILAVGLENPPDYFEAGSSPCPGDAPVHRTLLGNDICIIENLTNLDKISVVDPYILALPIKIFRGCGGPARVVALEGPLPSA